MRVVNRGQTGTSFGTGFLMHAPNGEGMPPVYMVTNKHVVLGADKLTIEFIARAPEKNAPALGRHVHVNIDAPERLWVGHPDPEVDVAALPIRHVIQALHSQIFYRSIPVTQMPEANDGVFMDVVEELGFIGYPNGQRDPYHLTPIVRRGTSATPLELPFAGKPSFLIDGSVFGGSSGSPVMLMDNGFYRTDKNTVTTGNRLVLVGIIAATMQRETLHPLLAASGPHIRVAQELNLGLVYNWHAIRQTLDAAAEKPPATTSALTFTVET